MSESTPSNDIELEETFKQVYQLWELAAQGGSPVFTRRMLIDNLVAATQPIIAQQSAKAVESELEDCLTVNPKYLESHIRSVLTTYKESK